jgi:hypothetical protein
MTDAIKRCLTYSYMANTMKYLQTLQRLGLGNINLILQGHNHNYQRTYPI